MKVNSAQLQIYQIDQIRTPHQQQSLKTTEANHFAKSQFADLLSAEEMRFIVQNFKPETISGVAQSHLGRFVDIRV